MPSPWTLSARLLYALPVVLSAALVIAATQSPEHAVGLAVMVLAAIAVGPRIRATDESQHIAAGLSLLPALVVALPFTREVPGETHLSGAWCVAASWAVLASASRLLMVDPAWGARATLGFGSLAVLFAGYARLHALYTALAWAFLVAALGAARVRDPARPSLRHLSRGTWGVAGAIVAGTLAFSAGSSQGLPRLHDYLVARYMHGSDDPTSSGFSPWLELGELRAMNLSEELVLRVYGPAPSYLRGTAYDRYERGRWRNSTLRAQTVVPTAPTAPRTRDAVRIERLGGIAGWYFVPLDAHTLSTPSGAVRRDRLGTVRVARGENVRVYTVERGEPGALAPAAPGPYDTEVPPALRPTLAPFVARWTVAAATDAARAEALRDGLRHHARYALRFARDRGVDPVVDFLTRHREGHCEYFASTLALLLRASGVPARVVGGYRVGERNPFGGYAVVREKNAHAWVEAWFDGAWHTLDATPAGAIPFNEPHRGAWWRAAGDYLALRFAALRAWAAAEGSTVLLGAAGVLLVAWLSWRAWKARNARDDDGLARDVIEGALPCLDELTGALSRAGVPRDPAETLERYAQRVEQSGLSDDARREAHDALVRYAAMRYGAVESVDLVDAAVRAAAARVRAG